MNDGQKVHAVPETALPQSRLCPIGEAAQEFKYLDYAGVLGFHLATAVFAA